VFVFLLAVVLRFTWGPVISLLGIKICTSHIVLGANSLILIALLLRTQEPCEKKASSSAT
jgi:hypothetical protein